MRDQPIGFWLKHLDRLIDTGFDRVIGTHDLTRRHWQVLRTLHHDPIPIADLDAQLAPFLTSDQPTALPVVEDLVGRGLVVRDGDDKLALTVDGERLHTELWDRVREERLRATNGINPEEYQATIDVLSRMAANLEHD